MRYVVAILAILVVANCTDAQGNEGCHVYVVDTSVAEKASRDGRNCSDESKCGVTTFPIFSPMIAEEQLTTKTYAFPGNKLLLLIARVKFSDEMFVAASADSVYLSITVAPSISDDLLATPDSAAAEFNITSPKAGMRVKRFYKIDGKEYLAGLQCMFTKLKI